MELEYSQGTPALAVYDSRLYAAFIGLNDHGIYTCSSADGLNWSPHAAVGQASSNSPALCQTTFSDKLWIAFRGVTSNKVLVCSYDGSEWSSAVSIGQTTTASPALAAFQGKLWVAFIASDGSADILLCSSADGTTWSKPAPVPGQQSLQAPALASCFNR